MYVLIMVFIIIALLISLFSVGVVGREVYLEEKHRRQNNKNQAAALQQESVQPATPQSASAPPTQIAQIVQITQIPQPQQAARTEGQLAVESPAQITAVPAITEEETEDGVISPEVVQARSIFKEAEDQAAATLFDEDVTETDLEATVSETADFADDGTVAFSAASQTLDEKYLDLCPEYKGYYDEIVRSAMAVEGSKRFKNAAYEEYKVGKNRVVRLKIRRGVVTCEFVIANLAFKTYAKDSKVAIKQAPARIKVIDEASLNAVKDSIGIAVQAINEEKEFKKEQAKLRRRQNRAVAKLAESAEDKAE